VKKEAEWAGLKDLWALSSAGTMVAWMVEMKVGWLAVLRAAVKVDGSAVRMDGEQDSLSVD